MFRLDAERAHEMGMAALKHGLAPSVRSPGFPFGPIHRFGLEFQNPLGLAAGFDKNGIAVNELAALGFGFVEVGTVTFQPQEGNPKPRMFRLSEDEALLNRLGFNNDGATVVAERLRNLKRRCVVGINIGKNKDVPNAEAAEDYLKTFDLLHPYADYVAINISSPNTPNLRELQRSENLEQIIEALQRRKTHKPLLVKIAPDLSETEIEAIVDTCLRYAISGIIATNTTISRAGVNANMIERFGSGGVSGKPLTNRSNAVISAVYRLSSGKLPIVGVGGIFTSQDAFDKIAAGASLIQAYTGFVYGGPHFARNVTEGLTKILKTAGFETLDSAVGTNVK